MNRKNDVIEMFGVETIKNRFNMLYQEMNAFIIKSGLSEYVTVDQALLGDAICDYFFDIYEFHKFRGTNSVNEEKVISHMAYWLLNRKPLQIYCEQKKYFNKLATVNERFVLLYILNYLSDRLGNIHILMQPNKDMKLFSERLFYLIVIGVRNAQILESVISLFISQYIYK